MLVQPTVRLLLLLLLSTRLLGAAGTVATVLALSGPAALEQPAALQACTVSV